MNSFDQFSDQIHRRQWNKISYITGLQTVSGN